MAVVSARAIAVYLAGVNVGAAGLFGWDKLQATAGGWRVSERDLCRSAVAGGWLGGLLAMHLFRHKTRKESFQKKYVKAIGQNAVVGVPVVALGWRSAGFRRAFVGVFVGGSRWIGKVFGIKSVGKGGKGGRYR